MGTVEKERKWWEEHINEEDELRKPYRSAWELQHWE